MDDQKLTTLQTLILSRFQDAAQISEQEHLQHQINRLRDPAARKACQDQSAYVEEHMALAAQQFRWSEDKYVDKHLKIEPHLTPKPVFDPGSYDERVQNLRRQFRMSPEGLKLAERTAERRNDLWASLNSVVRQSVQAETDRNTRRKTFMNARETSSFNRAFKRGIGR